MPAGTRCFFDLMLFVHSVMRLTPSQKTPGKGAGRSVLARLHAGAGCELGGSGMDFSCRGRGSLLLLVLPVIPSPSFRGIYQSPAPLRWRGGAAARGGKPADDQSDQPPPNQRRRIRIRDSALLVRSHLRRAALRPSRLPLRGCAGRTKGREIVDFLFTLPRSPCQVRKLLRTFLFDNGKKVSGLYLHQRGIRSIYYYLNSHNFWQNKRKT